MKAIKAFILLVFSLLIYLTFRYFKRKPQIITESIDFINRTVSGKVVAGSQKVYFTNFYSAKSSGRWYVIENLWISDDVYRISITANSNLVKRLEINFKDKTTNEEQGLYGSQTPIYDVLFRS